MPRRRLVFIAALLAAWPAIPEPAEAQDPGRVLRPLTGTLRSVVRGARPRVARPRVQRPRAARPQPPAQKEAVARARSDRRQAATGATAAGGAAAGAAAVGAAALWPSTSPSAYEDMLGYALWPREYAARFWSHGPHDIMQAMMAPAPPPPAGREQRGPRLVSAAQAREHTDEPVAGTTCIDDARERALRPIDRIPGTIDLIADQRNKLDDMRKAVAAAIDREAAACRKDTPGTPPERLRALIDGLWAMRYAEFGIRTSLQSFYDSLTQAQKDDLNGDQTVGSAAASGDSPAELCNKPVAASPNWFAPIERALRPTPEQQPSLKMLHGASMEMAHFLMTTCPKEPPATATARLDAAGDRVVALLHAAMNIEPLFLEFFGRLDDRQRARLSATLR